MNTTEKFVQRLTTAASSSELLQPETLAYRGLLWRTSPRVLYLINILRCLVAVATVREAHLTPVSLYMCPFFISVTPLARVSGLKLLRTWQNIESFGHMLRSSQYSYVIQKIYFQFFQNSLLVYRMVRSACNPRNGQRERLAVHIMGQPIYNHQILPLLKLLSDEHLHGTQLSSHLLPIIYPHTPSINVFLTNFPIMVFASPLQSSQPIGSWLYKPSHI